MFSLLDRLRQALMNIIAAVGSGGHGGNGGDPSGGGSPAPAYLASITVVGSTSVVATYTTSAFTATGKDQYGADFVFTPIFASGTTGVATINSSSGVATGVSAGTSAITAHATNSLGQVVTSNSVTLSVAARTVTTVVLAGGASSVIATHSTAAFTATAKDQNGTTMTGQTFVFSSGTLSVATINSGSGVALGVSAGTSSIKARCASIDSNLITLTVSAQVATSPIVVSPSSFSILAGNTQQLTAVVSDQGSPANVIVGAGVSWSSSALPKATVSGTGLVAGVSAGSATMTATSGSATVTSAATITAPVTPTSITAAPSSVSIAPGATQQLVVTDNFGNDVTSQCTFSITPFSVATLDAPTLTSVSPNTLAQGATNQDIALTGTNFTSAALGQTVAFSPGGGITINSTTFNSATSITVNVTLSGSATTGAGTVRVQDTNHGNSQTQVFSVTGTTPSIPFSLGVVLHLQADAGTSTTTNGAALASWTDQGTAGTVYAQGTAGSRPTYQSNAQNGLPVIRYDGVDDFLVAPGVVSALNVSRVAIFSAARRNTSGSDGLLFSNNDPTNNAGYGIGSSAQASLYYGTGTTSSILADPSSIGTSFQQFTWIIDPSATNKQEIRRNGTSVATSNTTSAVQSTIAPTIGSLASPLAYYGPYDAGELVIVNLNTNNLTLTQIQSMESYLKAKWGTP